MGSDGLNTAEQAADASGRVTCQIEAVKLWRSKPIHTTAIVGAEHFHGMYDDAGSVSRVCLNRTMCIIISQGMLVHCLWEGKPSILQRSLI